MPRAVPAFFRWNLRPLRFGLATVLALAGNGNSQTSPQDGATAESVPLAPEDGGPRRWTVPAGSMLTVHDAPSANAPSLGVLAGGTVLSNFGCVRAEHRIWCDVQPFRGGIRGFAAGDFLEPATGPDGIVALGRDESAQRALRRDFDARAAIACAQEKGEDLGQCTAAISRSGGGDATVVVTFPNGFSRRLNFINGEFVRADTTMSGTGRDIDWRIHAGMHIIRVDDQRFQVPDGFVIGN